MKPIHREVLFALILGMVVPGVLLGAAVAIRDSDPQPKVPTRTEPLAQHPTESEPITIHFREESGNLCEMELETYLVGVVCAEMPASFDIEALKAQAVVARTYTLKSKYTGGKHGDGSICGNYACCQAYTPEEAYLTGNPVDALEKIRSAVSQTTGQVLTYQGHLIEATYFSCSGGYTEDAVAVWGSDYPYLKATVSPGEENATHYTDTVYISRQLLEDKLELTLPQQPSMWIGPITYTAGGGVDTIVIGGTEFKGTYLRMALGLRSTAFTVTPDPSGITVTTKGYGHRVGMSQYGADAMAASGSLYPQILSYYYTGTQLETWQDN